MNLLRTYIVSKKSGQRSEAPTGTFILKIKKNYSK